VKSSYCIFAVRLKNFILVLKEIENQLKNFGKFLVENYTALTFALPKTGWQIKPKDL
jgi:hypothetical protein